MELPIKSRDGLRPLPEPLADMFRMEDETIPRPWTTNGKGLYPPENKSGVASVNPLEYLCCLRNLAPELLALWDAANQLEDVHGFMLSSDGRAKYLIDALEALNTKSLNLMEVKRASID